jgi:hypothetical protein
MTDSVSGSDAAHYGRGRVAFNRLRLEVMALIDEGYPASVVYARFKGQLGGIKLRQFSTYVARERQRAAATKPR